jgi:NADH dehydrogenase
MVRDLGGAEKLAGVDCELVRADMTDAESLRPAVAGCSTVVHLVAILAGKPADFERVMAQGARDLLAAAQDAGVERWVQMSALGTTRETKDLVPYYRAKWDAERAVEASGLAHVILRPSFVFGPDGGALPRFARIARLAPVTPIVGPGTQRLQPIWADDLAAIVSRCARGAESGLLQLGGPDVVDWNELWARLKRALGTRRPSLHIPFWLMRPQAFVLERLPNPPVTRDQLTMLAAGDNVAEPNDSLRFGTEHDLDLVPLDEQLRRAVAPG